MTLWIVRGSHWVWIRPSVVCSFSDRQTNVQKMRFAVHTNWRECEYLTLSPRRLLKQQTTGLCKFDYANRLDFWSWTNIQAMHLPNETTQGGSGLPCVMFRYTSSRFIRTYFVRNLAFFGVLSWTRHVAVRVCASAVHELECNKQQILNESEHTILDGTNPHWEVSSIQNSVWGWVKYLSYSTNAVIEQFLSN